MRLAILLSGRGSNFGAIHQAIEAGNLGAEIVCVISNRPDAPGIERARAMNLPAHVIDHRQFDIRAAHEAEVLRVLGEALPDFIALAGYMRLLSPAFIAAYPMRILNIHPSLLPAFPGVDAQAQAVAYGVKISGCTVHFVDENLDAGPIIVQRAVAVHADDDASTLAARILAAFDLAPDALAELGEERTLENTVADISQDADPAGGVLRSEAEAEVRAALAELPERTRTVLALRFYDNMDYQTIASTMGLSLGNVKTLIHRGKLALAHKLREREAVAEGKCATRTFRVVGGLGELQLV